MLKKLFLYTVHYLRIWYSVLICPQVCLLCGKYGAAGLPLCKTCKKEELDNRLALQFGKPHLYCRACGKYLISEKEYCTSCRAELTSGEKRIAFCDRVFTLFPYAGKCGLFLTEWKNKEMRGFADIFAAYAAEFIKRQQLFCGAVIVPVPPRPKKMKSKGWDQIEDMLLRLEKIYGLHVSRCLKRLDGASQKSLSKKERAVNLKNKIHVLPKKTLPVKAIILDDVMTTGATLNFCAQALKDAGCKEVYGLCLFFD